VADIEALYEGGHKAMIVTDPVDRRVIEGFCPLLLARPRSLSVLGGRGGGASVWKNLKVALGEVADSVRAWTGMDAQVAGHIRFDNGALLNAPWVATPIPDARVAATGSESANMARYLSTGGFVFLENAWGLLGPDFDFNAACRQLAQDVMSSAGLQHDRDWGYERLPQSHPLYHCYYDFDSLPVGMDSLMMSYRGGAINDYLEAITIEGRTWILFSQKGYLLGIHDFRPGGYYPGLANIEPMLQLCANTIIFALTQEGSLALRLGGVSTGVSQTQEKSPLPATYALGQNHPNPFNPATCIAYDLPEAADVTLSVYNIAGQRVATLASGHREAGRHRVAWDGTGLASGIYFYRLEAGAFSRTRRMVVLR
jgi:hypothetical protein